MFGNLFAISAKLFCPNNYHFFILVEDILDSSFTDTIYKKHQQKQKRIGSDLTREIKDCAF